MKKIFLVLVILCYPLLAPAEIIILKSGEKISGTILERNDDNIKIDFKGAPIKYYIFEVASIDGKPPLSAQVSSKDAQEIIKISAVSEKEYLERGIIYYSKGEFSSALLNFNQAIKINPGYATAYLQRGLAYAGLQDLKEGYLNYDKAIEINPKYADAYYIRGMSYARQRNLDQAISDYTKAIENKSDFIEAYLNRGFLYANKDEFALAESDLNKVISINPKVDEAYFFRGYVNFKKNEFDKAVSDYTKAIELNPDYAEAYLYRGTVYIARLNLEKSKADPNSPRAIVNIGPTYSDKVSLDQGISDTTRAIEINPKYAEAYVNRAKMYLFKAEYDLAWADVHRLEALGFKFDSQLLKQLREASGRDK